MHFLLSQMPFGNDGTFTYESFINVFNADLANTIGNLVSRTVAMTKKYFGGTALKHEITEALDKELFAYAEACTQKYHKCMDDYRNADACAAVFTLFKRCNKYIDETMPWALAKDEAQKDRLNDVLYNLLDLIKIIGVLLRPIMPETAQNIVGDTTSLELRAADSYTPKESANLFPRLDTEKVLAEIAAEQEAKAEPEKIEGIAQIGIEDFAKVELKAAKITACEPIPKAKKLLKLTLDDGSGTPRTVASGIAKWYKPEDLIGHTVIVVANLKPAKLCGVESNGMILAADCADDDVKVLFIDNVPAGSKIR